MVKKSIGYISYTHGLDGKVKIVPMVPCDEFEDLIENNQPIFDDKGVMVSKETWRLCLYRLFLQACI